MNVTTFDVALNQIYQHRLTYSRGTIRIENNSRYVVYVAIGQFANQTDIRAQAVLVIFPGQSRARYVLKNATLSILASDIPYALAGTISNSTDRVIISEDAVASPFLSNEIKEDALIGDYLVIAGGRIVANQNGFYARDLLGREVLAVNLAPTWPWSNQVMLPGDVMIGRGGQYIYWNNATGRLTISGDVNVTGGTGLTPFALDIDFYPGAQSLAWSNGVLYMSDFTHRQIAADSLSNLNQPHWLMVDLSLSGDLLIEAYPDPNQGQQYKVVGLFVPGNPVGTVFSFFGGSLISGNTIISGSIITANLAANAIDGMVITGATIRTDAGSIPNIRMDANGIWIKADDQDWIKWLTPTGNEVSGIHASQAGDVSAIYIVANSGKKTGDGQATLSAVASDGTVANVSVVATDSPVPNNHARLFAAGPANSHTLAVYEDRIDIDAPVGALSIVIDGSPTASGTIIIPPLTPGGAQGSITFKNGLIVSWSNPT